MPHADGREETRDARALLRSSRREARPQPRAAGVDPQLPARLRVDEPERADVRELLLARIPHLDRRGRVEPEPRDEHALGEVGAHVRLVRPRGHVPVHPPDVVSGNGWTDERELRSLPEEYRPVVTGEEPLDAPPDAEVERTQER